MNENLSLLPNALVHDTHWAIYEPAARQLIDQLAATNALAHKAEFDEAQSRSERVDSGILYDLGVEVYDGVAMIRMVGPMTKAPTSFSSGVSTVRVRRAVRACMASDEVKSLVLVIDSPGGSVSGTSDLADDVAACVRKKPVYAMVEDLCCSAAYWVACQCTGIYANETALIGSIGTYMVLYDASKMYENAGIKAHVLSTGKHKGAGATGAAIDDDQIAAYQQTVDDLNDHFLRAVSRGRKISRATVENLADGNVHIAQKALSSGLIDSVATFDQVMQMARKGAPPKGQKAESLETFSRDDISPAGMTLAEESAAALAAVAGLTERLVGLQAARKLEGRELSEKAIGHVSRLVTDLEAATIAAMALTAKPEADADESVTSDSSTRTGLADEIAKAELFLATI